MPPESEVRRARILAAFARRAVIAIRVQRRRLEDQERELAEGPADHDLDFYAHAAWTLREAGRLAAERLGLTSFRSALHDLNTAMPGLKDYRDMITHALDDRVDSPVWFGRFAVELLDGGRVRYLVDTRYGHHDALEAFADRFLDVLSDFAEEDLRESGPS